MTRYSEKRPPLTVAHYAELLIARDRQRGQPHVGDRAVCADLCDRRLLRETTSASGAEPVYELNPRARRLLDDHLHGGD